MSLCQALSWPLSFGLVYRAHSTETSDVALKKKTRPPRPSALSGGCHWLFIVSTPPSVYLQCVWAAVRGSSWVLPSSRHGRLCYLSSLTCCVHMECVDIKGSCLHCLFICVQTPGGGDFCVVCSFFSIQTYSYLSEPAANNSEYIGWLCNTSAVIQDFAWGGFDATCAGYSAHFSDCVSCNYRNSLNWNDGSECFFSSNLT